MLMEHQRAIPLSDVQKDAIRLEMKVQSNLLTRKEAAAYLGVAEQTLAIWKCHKRYGLPVVKVGRLVKYQLADLDAFIKSRTESA